MKWAFLLTAALLLYRHERKLRLYLLLIVRRFERNVRYWQRRLPLLVYPVKN
ncbi:MAG: hypothetical protein R2932_57425 [Caldilineaceae bacterium]